jgi:LPXTG-site transpeptidase (sortase) family protein
MQLASRGDYEQLRSAQDSSKTPAGSEQPTVNLKPTDDDCVAEEIEAIHDEKVSPIAVVPQFPVPANTPKGVDKVRSISPWLKQKRLIYGLWAASAIVFVFGAGLSIYSISQNNKITNELSEDGQVAGVSGAAGADGEVSESQPDLGSYMVAPNKPRYIMIEKSNTKGRVIEVGVDQSNNMAVPNNVFDGGWYNGSILPGSGPGAAVINGHVSGYTTSGIFYSLKDLEAGDKVSVELGSGQVIKYQVVEKKIIAADSFNILDVLNPVEPRSEGLNLITCGGQFDAASENYAERVLVFTKRI